MSVECVRVTNCSLELLQTDVAPTVLNMFQNTNIVFSDFYCVEKVPQYPCPKSWYDLWCIRERTSESEIVRYR